MKLTLPNIADHEATCIIDSTLGIRQETVSLPKHSVTALPNESRDAKVTMTERIQFAVDNANVKVVRARSHFRAWLRSPLVLFHNENSREKRGHQAD
jgi:radical SAM superfamily enzyme